MKNIKLWKLSVPALTMSALVFELLPGSVDVWQKDMVAAPEISYNFFNLSVDHRAVAFCPLRAL